MIDEIDSPVAIKHRVVKVNESRFKRGSNVQWLPICYNSNYQIYHQILSLSVSSLSTTLKGSLLSSSSTSFFYFSNCSRHSGLSDCSTLISSLTRDLNLDIPLSTLFTFCLTYSFWLWVFSTYLLFKWRANFYDLRSYSLTCF